MKLREFARYLLPSLWLFGPGVITVLLGYFLLIQLSQGRDVLMQAGEDTVAFVATIGAVLLWAFFVWYGSRIIGYEKKFNAPAWPVPMLSLFPRLLAYNTFVSVQVAILCLPTFHPAWHGGHAFAVACLHNAAYYVFHQTLAHLVTDEKRNRSAARGWAFASVLLILLYVAFLLSHRHAHSTHQQTLPWLACLVLACQLFALWIFFWRRSNMPAPAAGDFAPNAQAYLRVLGYALIRVPAPFQAHEQGTFQLFHAFALAAIALFATTLISLLAADAFGPLAIVLLSFALLVGGFNIIAYLSARVRFNLFVPLLLVAWLVGHYLPDPYRVVLNPAPQAHVHQSRPTLQAFLDRWMSYRHTQIDSSAAYPVYVVLADGGASRAGYWVASVLAQWQEQSLQQGDPLSDHLLTLSGASGGSLGNGTFYSLLHTPPPDTAWVRATQAFLGQDYLSYTLARYFGTDLANHVVPIFYDRAAALARVMNHWGDVYLQGAFRQNIHELYANDGRLPIWFINTTRVQEGTPSVVSNVRLTGLPARDTLNRFTQRLDVLARIDAHGYGHEKERALAMSTAVMLSARFPYVSPAGAIGHDQFVDGGYFDNSGAGIVHEMLQAIQKMQRDTTQHATFLSRLRKLRIHVIHIANTPPPGSPAEAMHPLVNDLAAPLLTVLNTYGTQTTVNDQRLRTFVDERCACANAYHTINLYRPNDSRYYPMNWAISRYHLDLMNERLQEITYPSFASPHHHP
ncbi:MAG: patatin-like phospholipase family protein [Cyclobacteriaceae bacterium]|jgi:hypothetical protein|nr:patatin-like phospholipase family protein [Cyclobacteriaceae bacterium]